MDTLIQQYIKNDMTVSSEIALGLDEIMNKSAINKRSELVNFLFLEGRRSLQEQHLSDARYCVSFLVSLLHDSNKRMFPRIQWDDITISKELIEFMDFGINMSERMFKIETIKLIGIQVIFSFAVFLLLLFGARMDLALAISTSSLLFLIDLFVILYIRNKKAKNIADLSISKGVKGQLHKFVQSLMN